jgi:prepilin-type N-terminal cleavage/methylation domain-containing protein
LTGRSQGGFGLIELLVVVAVVSVLSVGASLPFSRSSPSAASEANELAKAVSRLRSLSILSDATHAISIDEHGWRAERIIPGAEPRAVPHLERSVRSRLTVLGGVATNGPGRVVILPDGTSTRIRLRIDGDGGPVLCAGAGDGNLACAPG